MMGAGDANDAGSVATETSPLLGGSGLAALSASAEWDGRDLFVSTPLCPRAYEEGHSVANASERRGLPEGPTSRGWRQRRSSSKGGEKLVWGRDRKCAVPPWDWDGGG